MSKKTLRDVAPSRATRRIGRRSRISSRVTTTYHHGGEAVRLECESSLEAKVLFLLQVDPQIVDIREQAPRISYVTHDGRKKAHVFDFLVTRRDGTRRALVVKPQQFVERPGFYDDLRAIRAGIYRHVADEVRLITDAHFTADRAQNARRAVCYRRIVLAAHDAALDTLLPHLTYLISMAEIAAKLGLGGAGFQAAFVALYDGGLQADLDREITGLTQVRRGVDR